MAYLRSVQRWVTGNPQPTRIRALRYSKALFAPSAMAMRKVRKFHYWWPKSAGYMKQGKFV